MPWKIGGNFEIVRTKCEANWRECAIAIANYLWCEMVSDVVDYLGKEGMIWVLIAAVIYMILLRVKYRKNTHMQNVTLGKQILNKVGYKIHDLELKVNVLTYKMQYGTWPLPHQIYSLNPKKLQKIKMTLSNSGSHKSWINHVLLSPMKSSMCLPYSDMFSSSETKLSSFPDIRGKRTARQVEHNELGDCSSTENPESTTSDQVVKYKNLRSQVADMYSQNASTRDSDRSKSENSILRHQNMRPSEPNEIEDRSTEERPLTEKHVTPSMSKTKCSPCQEFSDTIHKCKSFLKELQCKDKHLHLSRCSSETSKTCSLKQSIAPFATQNGDVSHQVTPTEKELDGTRCAEKTDNSETMENGEETCRPNAAISTSCNDIATFSKESCPTSQSTHNAQSSQETLHEIRRRLESLHKVLQAYQDASRSSEQEDSKKDERVDETNTSVTSIEIWQGDNRCKTDTERDVDSQENPRKLQHSMDNREYFDHSADSLSSLTGCSSNSSKMYPSNAVTRNPCSEGPRQHCLGRRPVDLPPFSATTKLFDREQSSRFYGSPTSQASLDRAHCENKYDKDAICAADVPEHARSSDSRVRVDEGVTNAHGSIHLEERIPEAVPEGIRCIFSPRSFKNKSTSTEKAVPTRRFVEILDNGEQKRQGSTIVPQSGAQMLGKAREDAMMSQSGDQTLNDSDREEKSTALLLQEAFHFKKVLSTRVDLAKKTRQVPSESESLREYKKTEQRENNDQFPSTIIDIETEEPVINDSCCQMSQRYIHLEMKQRRSPLLPSKKLNTLTRCENEQGSRARICEVSSKYFNITDFAIRDYDNENNVKMGGDVLSSIKPPIYEKMISIMIPVDARTRDEIGAKNKTGGSKMQMNDTVAGDNRTGANSSESLRENKSTDNIGDNVIERSSTTQKLEDLILERIRNIRDYMDMFLRNQNKVISEVRRSLQYPGENEPMLALRCSAEANNVMLHKHLIAISKRDSRIDRTVRLSSGSPDLSLNTWPNRRNRKVLLDDHVLRYCSNVNLTGNSETFALVAPKSEISDKSNARSSKITAELEKGDTFQAPYEKDTRPAHKITDLTDEPHLTKHIVPSQENGQTNQQIITDTLNTDSQKHESQTQNAESTSSAISSRYSLDDAETDTRTVQIVRDKLPAISTDRYSTSNSSSYYTNATVSTMRMEDVFSKPALNLVQSRAVMQKETEQSQTISGENDLVEEFTNTSVETSKLSSNLEHSSSLKTLVDNSNLTPGESECDCSTSARTTLNENNVPYDADMSPPLSLLNVQEETLKTDDGSLSNIERNNEISANVAHSSSGTESHSTRQLLHPRVRAKSDESLTVHRRKDLNVNFPEAKRSFSFLTRHDSLAHVQRTLHQSHINIHVQYDNRDEFTENKLQFTDRSKSVVPSQRASTRSCIPISKNRLEPVRRMRHQTHARSPTRGPLTVSCKEKSFAKNHTIEDKEVAQRRNIPINRQLRMKDVTLNLINLDMHNDIFVKDFEKINQQSNVAYKNDKIPLRESSKLLSDEKSPTTDKEHSGREEFIRDNKSDMGITDRENATYKTIAVISIMANEDIRKDYPANSFILKTENVCSATDILRHKDKLWTITIERTEKKVTAKPSIMDTSTSVSEVTLKMN